jgi:hypothetical protein
VKRALLLALLTACPGPRSAPPSVQPQPQPDVKVVDSSPALVVLVIVDQFPEWSFERKRPELTGGFARLLAEGEWRVGRHPSGATITAPGHALLGTGEPPAQSGINANEWWSRELGRVVKAGEDENGNTSSRWLRVPGLGDSVASAKTGAKAVAVSMKNRAARLPLGHSGIAIYYDVTTASFASHGATTPWLAAYNRAHPILPRLDVWRPLDSARLARLTGVADAQPGEVGTKGFGRTFPHDPKATKNPAGAVFALPLGNELVLETALAAIDGEQLGADRTIDLLIVSLSAHDYIAHGWGHESWELWDSELRLDAALDSFLAELDRKVGKGRWAMVLTSDHGGSPLPETLGGGRYNDEQIRHVANKAAALVLGPGDWIAYAKAPMVFLSAAALARDPKDLNLAMKKIGFALRALPGLAFTDRVDAVIGRCDERQGDARALCLSFDRERAGEFFYLPAKGWITEEADDPLATAHGSLNDYDRNVPVLLLPFERTPHAPATTPTGEMSLTEIAPLVASWLGVPSPTTLPR